MKRLLAVIAGGLGLRALWRRRARSGSSPAASDLRAKLDEHRALEADRLADEAGQTPVDEAQALDAQSVFEQSVDEQSSDDQRVEGQCVEGQSVEGRRAEVHERARRALDELS
jgi:hypothetical protein